VAPLLLLPLYKIQKLSIEEHAMFTRENGQMWVKSPEADGAPPKGVWVYPSEDIEWHYVCTPLGMLVSGYTIKPSRIDSQALNEAQ
jgi:hypothetical protein